MSLCGGEREQLWETLSLGGVAASSCQIFLVTCVFVSDFSLDALLYFSLFTNSNYAHSPSCADSPCPKDVPEGVTASPLCALQSPQGDKFCAILCKPSSDENKKYQSFLRAHGVNALPDDITGGECGPMSCVPIPQAAGMGICVYDSSVENDITAVGAM